MITTQQKGKFAELKVEIRAYEKGWMVSRPTSDCRYDLVLDDGIKLFRVQVKYAGGKGRGNGTVNVGLRRWAGDKSRKTRNYRKHEVDAILVYLPSIDRVCWLGPEMFENKPAILLRVEPPSKKRTKSMNFASDLVW